MDIKEYLSSLQFEGFIGLLDANKALGRMNYSSALSLHFLFMFKRDQDFVTVVKRTVKGESDEDFTLLKSKNYFFLKQYET